MVATSTAFASPSFAAPAAVASPQTWTVSPGTGTISQAVAKAKAGDTLVLKAGTFIDSVLIDKTLTIRGAGWSKTAIKPPASASNTCNNPGKMQGFCVVGVLDSIGFPVLTKPVRNVTISGLSLSGFSSGVIGFNTEALNVHQVRSEHNTDYGIARFWSTRSNFSQNWTSWNGEAGLYLGDSPTAASVVRGNRSDHNGIGIFLRDSTGLTATGNTSWGNCVGILALNSGSGAPGDLPAGDIKVTDNIVRANNLACPPHDDIPGYSGLGIALAGVHDVVVRDNTVNSHDSTNASDLLKGGVVVLSTAFLGGVDPTNNTVTDNDLRNNKPADIVWDGKGAGNKFKGNECKTVMPSSIGSCTR